jgi:hypothetical protein
VQILEGGSYRFKFPWVGVLNQSRKDINEQIENDFFANTPEYKHLAHRMGSDFLVNSLSTVCLSPFDKIEPCVLLIGF